MRIKRKELGISLDELAARSKRSKNYLGVIERNVPHYRTKTLPNPSNALFDDIARGLDLPAQEVRDAWARFGNGNQENGEMPVSESDPGFVNLKALYNDMEEADREEMTAYAQFRMFRRNPQSELLPTALTSPEGEASAVANCLRLDMQTGAVYARDGQRITARAELLEIAAMIKSQVTELELPAAQRKKAQKEKAQQ